MFHPLQWLFHILGILFHWSICPAYVIRKLLVKKNTNYSTSWKWDTKLRLLKFTWKLLWTHVTRGSFRIPLAWGWRGPFAIFSDGDKVSGETFVALNSFSKMSTSSFNKKFKNSWASYKFHWQNVNLNTVTNSSYFAYKTTS